VLIPGNQHHEILGRCVLLLGGCGTSLDFLRHQINSTVILVVRAYGLGQMGEGTF